MKASKKIVTVIGRAEQERRLALWNALNRLDSCSSDQGLDEEQHSLWKTSQEKEKFDRKHG